MVGEGEDFKIPLPGEKSEEGKEGRDFCSASVSVRLFFFLRTGKFSN